jgi:hypothetical protein
MSIKELLETFSHEQNFKFGIDIVMESLRPNCLYELNCINGEFTISSWDKNNILPSPTSQEIRDEYIRHKTIYEFLEYLKENTRK